MKAHPYQHSQFVTARTKVLVSMHMYISKPNRCFVCFLYHSHLSSVWFFLHNLCHKTFSWKKEMPIFEMKMIGPWCLFLIRTENLASVYRGSVQLKGRVYYSARAMLSQLLLYWLAVLSWGGQVSLELWLHFACTFLTHYK